MKEEDKKCWSCGRFQRYYTKGICNLNKEKVGFCFLQNKIMCQDESCKMWNYREKLRNVREKRAKSSIVDIRSKLEVIERILLEEKEAEEAKNKN